MTNSEREAHSIILGQTESLMIAALDPETISRILGAHMPGSVSGRSRKPAVTDDMRASRKRVAKRRAKKGYR